MRKTKENKEAIQILSFVGFFLYNLHRHKFNKELKKLLNVKVIKVILKSLIPNPLENDQRSQIKGIEKIQNDCTVFAENTEESEI